MKFICYAYFLLLALLLSARISAAQSPPGPLPPAATNSSAVSEVEDFSTPSLATSRLQPEPPELVEQSEELDFVREWVTVQWRPVDPIYLYVIRPRNVEKPPVVIYLYDYPYETDIYRDDDWCKRVTSGGYAAVGFVPALTGHRYHDRPMKEWFVSELQESLSKSAHDVQMVLNYLASRGNLDMDRVGIFGAGAGGTIAIAAASADSRIKAMDLLDPWGDWAVWTAKSEVIPEGERANYIKPEFLQKIAAFDPVALLPKLKAQSLRLTQTEEDLPNTPDAAKKQIEGALPAAGERRRFKSSGSATSGDPIYAWLKARLKPGHSAKPPIG